MTMLPLIAVVMALAAIGLGVAGVRKRNPILLSAAIMLGVVLVGATLFYLVEAPVRHKLGQKFTFFDALYWAIVTVTTVGYGDITPITPQGKLIAIGLIVFGIAAYTLFVTSLAEALMRKSLEQVLGLGRLKRVRIVVVGSSEECLECIDELREALPGAKIGYVTSEKPPREPGVPYVVGVVTEEDTLVRGGVDRAETVIVCCENDTTTLHVALLARKLNPRARIIAIVRSRKIGDLLLAAGVDDVVSSEMLAHIAAVLVYLPPVAHLLEELVTVKGRIDVSLVPALKYVGMSFAEVVTREKSEHDRIPIAIVEEDGTVIANPPPDYKVKEGDRLLAVAGRARLLCRGRACIAARLERVRSVLRRARAAVEVGARRLSGGGGGRRSSSRGGGSS